MCILEIDNLCKNYYPDFHLSNVSFKLEKGVITGLVGPNGAGKSTIIKSILKIVRKDSGTIKYCGKDIDSDCYNIYKQSIGYVGESVDFFKHATLEDISLFYRKFYPKWNDDKFRSLLHKFELRNNSKMKQLSKGMRVKYAIALCLSHEPDFMLMDEPTSGLDPIIRSQVLSIIRSYVIENNACVLFSSHIIEDLEKIADNIIFLNKGRVIESDSKSNINNEYGSIESYINAKYIAEEGDIFAKVNEQKLFNK